MSGSRLLSAALVVCGLALWEAAVRGFQIPAFILPPPLVIFRTAVLQAPLLASHAAITALEILAGCLLALAVADYQQGKQVKAEEAAPIYLRDTVVHRSTTNK